MNYISNLRLNMNNSMLLSGTIKYYNKIVSIRFSSSNFYYFYHHKTGITPKQFQLKTKVKLVKIYL